MENNIIEILEQEDRFFSKKTGMHLFGYSLVGAISNCFEIGLLFLLVEVFHVWYLLGSVCAFTFGSIASFLGRRIFVFKKKGLHKIKLQIISYAFFYVIGITINSFIMRFLVEGEKIHYALSYITAAIVVGILGFLWNKTVTFRMRN